MSFPVTSSPGFKVVVLFKGECFKIFDYYKNCGLVSTKAVGKIIVILSMILQHWMEVYNNIIT